MILNAYLQHICGSSLSEKGSGLVGQIFSVGFTMASFLVLLAIMSNAAKDYKKTQDVVTMVEAEVRLISFLQNYDSLKALSSQLKTGQVGKQDLVFNGVKVGRIGSPLYLDRDNAECKSTSDSQCRLQIETGISCQNVASGSICNAAYRISSLHEATPPLGVKHAGAFVASDFNIPLSYEVTMRAEVDACDSNSDLFAVGMNRETGKVWCLRKPATTCASGEIAKGFKYDSAKGSLEPICQSTQSLKCPTNYVLNSFKISSLEAGQAKSGDCVFVTKKEVPWKTTPGPAASVSGTYCPQHYKTKATCSVTVTNSWNGSCSYSCNCTATGCDTCYSTSSPSNVGAYSLTQGSDRTASCSINPGAQSCGAGWTGVVNLTGTCVLTEPEKVGAQ